MRVNYDDLDYSDDQLVCQYQGKPFTGVAYETDAQGRLISEVPHQNGFRHGVVREWFPSGQLQSEVAYQRGGAHGVSKSWYENGRMESETVYELGIQTRKREWDREGKLTSESELKENDPMFSILQLRRRGSAG